jgi:hypothetical protein
LRFQRSQVELRVPYTTKMQKLPVLLRILIYVAAAASVLAVVAVGVGVMAALVIGPNEGSSSQQADPRQVVGEAQPERASKQGNAAKEDVSDGLSNREYLSEIADIQNRSVEAALESNEKLVRYDSLTADDIGDLEANYTALKKSSAQVEELNPPEEYEDQYKVFVLAIDSLRNANELAYHLAADPASATQADFEAYDRHIDRATSDLQRSNEMLDRNYKTTNAAQEISFG